jgi:putative ABC transport system substrate-binding protein
MNLRRRDFITLLGGATAAWPLAARAQQQGERVRRVGVLMPYVQTDPGGQARLQALRQGLAGFGWFAGRNIRIDERWAGPDVALQRSYARELIALAPDVILVSSTSATQALRDATSTIPIVFLSINDPVTTGLVSNLARPDTNVTGFLAFEYSLAGKWLSLLKDAAPGLSRISLLFNPDTTPTSALYLRSAQDAGERLTLNVTAAEVRDETMIEPAIAAIAGSNDGGLIVLPDLFNIANGVTTILLTAKYRVPAIYSNRLWAASGGLISYGVDQELQFREGATYVDRILRGAKPADLPVQTPSKYELVVNLKTAKMLGLAISHEFLLTADEVIE